jgi:hypothetical protein
LVIAITFLPAGGCHIVGPASIRSGRAVYNEAIIATNNQQVLAMIVRMRYGEPSGLLAVTSVTANVSLRVSADSQFGIGAESSFEGNLVPLSAGAAYEENPTISYVPVQGEKYLRQFLSPLPLDLTVLLLSASKSSPQFMTLLVRTINGVRNPESLSDPPAASEANFARIADLFAALDREGFLTWAQEKEAFVVVLKGEGEAYAQEVRELCSLLGLRPPRDLAGIIKVPVYLGVGEKDDAAIAVVTRSLYDLFMVAAACVDIPDEHVESGLARRVPPPGPVHATIRIRRSKDRPKTAMVAVQLHDWWYWIDATDPVSKETFRTLEALLSVRMAESIDRSSATPVLTVPVAH